MQQPGISEYYEASAHLYVAARLFCRKYEDADGYAPLHLDNEPEFVLNRLIDATEAARVARDALGTFRIARLAEG